MADETVTKAQALNKVAQQWFRDPVHTLYDLIAPREAEIDTLEANIAGVGPGFGLPGHYGVMYGGATGVLNISQSAYTLLDLFDEAGTCYGVTADPDTAKFTITEAGTYLCQFWSMFDPVSNDDTYLRWHVNGSPAGVEWVFYQGSGYTGFMWTFYSFFTFSAADYVQPMAKMAFGAARNITPWNSVYTVLRIR